MVGGTAGRGWWDHDGEPQGREKTVMSEETADPSGEPAAEREPGARSPAGREPSGQPAPDAEPGPDADAGADEAGATFAGRFDFRPVDWDGSFSRVWRARHGQELTNELAAEQERRENRKWFERYRQELLDRMDAESAREAARRRAEDRERAVAEGGRPARGAADEALLRKLELLDRFPPVDPGDPDEPAGPAGPADPR
ncbi:hypothetical protein CEDDRAFT_01658 [Frankia sp. CeD]|nr:hypothetical protein CEDDRAFT_01658 [Frankia sp. CeD]